MNVLICVYVCVCQVERLKSQVDSRACQQQKRIRERAADAKRIQDLERQVLLVHINVVLQG